MEFKVASLLLRHLNYCKHVCRYYRFNFNISDTNKWNLKLRIWRGVEKHVFYNLKLMLEAVYSSAYKSTQRQNPEDHGGHIYRRQNLKLHIMKETVFAHCNPLKPTSSL